MLIISFVVRLTPMSRSWLPASMTIPGEVKVWRNATNTSRGYCVAKAMAHSELPFATTSCFEHTQQRYRWQICVNASVIARKMKGLWLPLPMATLSHPQKWSNSSTHAPVWVQYFMRRPFSTQVVVHKRPKSGTSPARKALIMSSTPDAPFTREDTFPGSERATVKNRAREAGTPSSKQSETFGAASQLIGLKSVRYWKRARETLTSQKVAAAFCMAFFLSFSASSFPRSLLRSPAPIFGASTSASPPSPARVTLPREQLTSSCRSRNRRMAVSWLLVAMSRQVRPCESVCDGSTCLSSRNSQTPPCEACTARCSGVMRVSSRQAKSASK
mmetsp:Transcript_116794/g.341975  ORF Transcript_116794/g.341975 Transcript_116794/m.341975 type:complete len:330 (+) Transcript_116794:256-1245(+)